MSDTLPRRTILRAVADRAHALANDGESAPDYRWVDQYIASAAARYGVRLTALERQQVEQMVKDET